MFRGHSLALKLEGSQSEKGMFQHSLLGAVVACIIAIAVILHGLLIPLISTITFYFSFIIIIFLIKHQYDKYLPVDIALVFLFGFLYYSIGALHGINKMNFAALKEIITPVLAYYLGYQFARTGITLHWSILLSISGAVMLGVLSIFNYALENMMLSANPVAVMERRVPLIWGNDVVLVATGIGLNLSLGICLLVAVFSNLSFRIKFLCAVIGGASLLADILIQTRSPVYAGIAALLVAGFIWFKKNGLRCGYLTIVFFVLGLLISIFYIYGIYWVDGFKGSPLLARFSENGVQDVRYGVWAKGIFGIFENPFGGMHSDPSPARFFHNLWLDVGWFVGLFPVVILLILQIRHIRAIWKLAFRHPGGVLVLGTSISFFVGIMVEPILPGYGNYFILYLFFLGMIKKFATQFTEGSGRVISGA